LTEEYNTILFSWYFKGFEFLRWYLAKDPVGVDFKNLRMTRMTLLGTLFHLQLVMT